MAKRRGEKENGSGGERRMKKRYKKHDRRETDRCTVRGGGLNNHWK